MALRGSRICALASQARSITCRLLREPCASGGFKQADTEKKNGWVGVAPTHPFGSSNPLSWRLVSFAGAVPTVSGAAISARVTRGFVAPARHALIGALVTALSRARVAAALAASAGACLGAVAKLAVVALGIARANTATTTAGPRALRAARVTAIGQVTVATESAIRIPVCLLPAIIGAVVAILAGVTGAVVITSRRVARIGALVARCAARARVATRLA